MSEEVVSVTPTLVGSQIHTTLGDIYVYIEYAVVDNQLVVSGPRVEFETRPGTKLIRLSSEAGINWKFDE